MNFKYREPLVGLELGTQPSDMISDAIRNTVGVREVARRSGFLPSTVSQWATGSVVLRWSTAMKICSAAGMDDHLWAPTLCDRVSACERLGFDFYDRTNDQPEQDRRKRAKAEAPTP